MTLSVRSDYDFHKYISKRRVVNTERFCRISNINAPPNCSPWPL